MILRGFCTDLAGVPSDLVSLPTSGGAVDGARNPYNSSEISHDRQLCGECSACYGLWSSLVLEIYGGIALRRSDD